LTAAPVRARGLAKRFGRRTALAGVDLDVAAGEVVALVGPNGSGKTTLLRILAGLARASAGEARLFGLDPRVERAGVMRRARFAFAPPALFSGLSAREHLRALGGLGVPRDGRPARAAIEDVLALVGLHERADDRVDAYSFGMRQRLALAIALLPRPELIVLDEPADGLDPLAVLELGGILAGLARERGTTVLLSSHLLLEVGALADRLVVLREGGVLLAGRPAELVAETRRVVLVSDDVARAERALATRGIPCERRGAELLLAAGALTLDDAARLLAGAGARLTGFHVRAATLEEVVLARLAAEHVA
jgi:ABC-2 type transport system ATP-binding protein